MTRPAKPGRRLEELAALVNGEVVGDGAQIIFGVGTLADAGPGQLSFFGNARYKKALETTRASAVLVGSDAPPPRTGVTFVRVANPHLAFARIAAAFHPVRKHAPGTSPGAHVHPQAVVDPSATVMAGATVSLGAVVGARAVLYPGVFLGEHAAVGEDTVLAANVSIGDRCQVGARCVFHASVVIGADGFGFAFDPEKAEHVKIPQAGIVRVEDDVEIGACSCVDRATVGETVIGKGAKIDNLVQVGHNCVVGPLSLICAQVGLSGSTELGTMVMIGGQAGSAGHLKIGDLAKIGAQAGLMSDVGDGETLLGSPALGHKDFLRSWALFAKLPELQRELRELKKRLDAEGKKR